MGSTHYRAKNVFYKRPNDELDQETLDKLKIVILDEEPVQKDEKPKDKVPEPPAIINGITLLIGFN